MDFKVAGKIALWSCLGSLLFVLVLYIMLVPVSLATIVSACALVTAGGGVVGGLIAISLAEEDH